MSRDFMINTHPTIHVHTEVNVGESFGPMGWWTAIPPHGEGFDFETDGLVAEPGVRCVAYAESKGDGCYKDAIVALAITTLTPGHFGRFHLCGAHLAMHRRGRPVRLAI